MEPEGSKQHSQVPVTLTCLKLPKPFIKSLEQFRSTKQKTRKGSVYDRTVNQVDV